MKLPNYRDLLAAARPNLGIGLADARAVRPPTSHTFANAAGSRGYTLHVPLGYHGQVCPLVVMLHGCTQSANDFARGTHMNVLADKATCLVAYPEQSTAANPQKCWNWFDVRDQRRGSGEPSIVAGITNEIAQLYAVDRERVYVAGLSAGGAAAAVLGAVYPDVYAAVGVHSGIACGLAHDIPSAFAAMRSGDGHATAYDFTVPAIVFHGDRDTTVHPNNGERFIAGNATVGTAKHVTTGHVPNGRTYTKTTYTDGSGRIVREHWTIHGAGHAWSGGDAAGSFTDPRGPDASREMLRFFLSHRRRA